MKVESLDKWFSINEYDPERKELNLILKLGKVKGKRVLVIGIYGLLSISAKVAKSAKIVLGIHNNKRIVEYCKNKYDKVQFQFGNLEKMNFPNNSFDTIISSWTGLHYLRNKISVIKELKRVLKKEGILIIEEADETSEYVTILNMISPFRRFKIRKKKNNFKKQLNKKFYIREQKLCTYYNFKNPSQFKDYFEKEIVIDEKKKFTKRMGEILDNYIKKKRNLRVEEKAIFWVCKPL